MMGSHGIKCIFNPKIDFPKLTVDDVYFAYQVRVPFRFRVQKYFNCDFVNKGNNYEIWIDNEPILHPRIKSFEANHSYGTSDPAEGLYFDSLCSTVAVISQPGKITEDELDNIRNSKQQLNPGDIKTINRESYFALQALNAFIIGYQITTGELYSGSKLQILNTDDFMQHLTFEFILIGFPLTYWNESTVIDLFQHKRTWRRYNFEGGATALPPEKLSNISRAIDRINSFYFYELAFEAKTKMGSGDYIGALLMAVAALEGVHGAFVNHSLGNLLPNDRSGDDKSLEENFIKELGFSLCNKLTPYLFMDATERPDEELIQNVSLAIKYRNEVMHSLRNSAGVYRIRNRTNRDLNNAYGSALKLYEIYRIALERIIDGNNSSLLADSVPN